MDKFQKNQDLVRLSFYGIIIGVIVVSIIAILASVRGIVQSETSYNSIANIEVDNRNTGSIEEKTISIIGVEHISKTNINADINNKAVNMLRLFVTLTYPEAKNISVKDGSPKVEDDIYTYTVISDTGVSFNVKVQETEKGNYKMSISDKNNEIFSYEAKDYIDTAKDPRLLAKLLPKTFYDSDPTVSVTKDYDNNYYINVNACGDEDIINYAKTLVDEWVEQNGFDPSTINYTIPDYCDGVS